MRPSHASQPYVPRRRDGQRRNQRLANPHGKAECGCLWTLRRLRRRKQSHLAVLAVPAHPHKLVRIGLRHRQQARQDVGVQLPQPRARLQTHAEMFLQKFAACLSERLYINMQKHPDVHSSSVSGSNSSSSCPLIESSSSRGCRVFAYRVLGCDGFMVRQAVHMTRDLPVNCLSCGRRYASFATCRCQLLTRKLPASMGDTSASMEACQTAFCNTGKGYNRKTY